MLDINHIGRRYKRMRNILKQRKATVLQNQKGFTLVEMLIVLVLIGLAVSMMVGIFGNPFANASIDSAATRVIDDLRSIEGAAQAYKVKEGTTPTKIISATPTDSTLVSKGYLKLAPTPPSPITSGTNYAWDTTGVTAFGASNTTADTVATLLLAGDASSDICKAINKAANGTDALPTSATPDPAKNIQCVGTSAPYTAIIPIFVQ